MILVSFKKASAYTPCFPRWQGRNTFEVARAFYFTLLDKALIGTAQGYLAHEGSSALRAINPNPYASTLKSRPLKP